MTDFWFGTFQTFGSAFRTFFMAVVVKSQEKTEV